jgi:hypothetical protein
MTEPEEVKPRRATKNPGSRLSLLDLTGLGKLPNQSDREAHSQRLVGPKLKIRRNPATTSTVGCSDEHAESTGVAD